MSMHSEMHSDGEGPVALCGPQAGGDCAEEERCAVLFEAPSFERLGEELSGWLSERTDYEPVSFSHAVETRWQRSSAFANSQPVPSYTGMLLVRHQ